MDNSADFGAPKLYLPPLASLTESAGRPSSLGHGLSRRCRLDGRLGGSCDFPLLEPEHFP
jgi:hypothetical protein